MSETTITRRFWATPERVWRAWTEPAEIVRWWGKRGWTARHATMDPRPGGRFRIESVHDADGTEMVNEGVWREVVPFERLAFASSGGEALSVVTFVDLGDGRTEMRFTTTAPLSGRALAGFHSGLDRLAELLEHDPRSTRSTP